MAAQGVAAQAGGGQLALYTEKHPAFAHVFSQDVLPMLEQNLVGNTDGLTVKRIALDLAAMLMANPKLAATDSGVSRVRQEVVFGLILEATRYHTTFGDGGLWAIPDDGNPQTPVLRAQQSKKFIVRRAMDDTGCEILAPVWVFQADHPVLVERNEAGDIIKFTLNKNADITAERAPKDLLGGFGRAITKDGKMRIRWFSKADLENYRRHSKIPDGPAWKNDTMEMYGGSLRAAIGREFAPIRSRVPGMVSSATVPLIEMEQAVDGEFRAPTAASAAADLAAMGEAEGDIPFGGQPVPAQEQATDASPDPVERARAMFKAQQTVEGLDEAWKSDAMKDCMARADQGQRKHIANMRAEREKEIREAVVAAARAQQADGALTGPAQFPDSEVAAAVDMIHDAMSTKEAQQLIDGFQASYKGRWSEAQEKRAVDAFNAKYVKLSGGMAPPKAAKKS